MLTVALGLSSTLSAGQTPNSCLNPNFLPPHGMTTRRACISVTVVMFVVVSECSICLGEELQGWRVAAEAAVAVKMAGGRRCVLPPDQNGETPVPADHPPAAHHRAVCALPFLLFPLC